MYAEDLEHVARHRIIVCTCATAGSLYGLRLVPGHFTHAFVDESGQATEPECLVALGLVANAGGQTVLAGDPMQLGPVLRSKYCVKHGLQESLLERLINRTLYQRDEEKFSGHGCYDPFLVSKCFPICWESMAYAFLNHSCFVADPQRAVMRLVQ
jgi:putative helicase MOV10L1